MKPMDLKVSDRLDTALGVLVVADEPWEDLVNDEPQWDRVFVDVTAPSGKFGDPDRLPEVTGADDFQWLGLSPLRYRLAFRPDADVQATRPDINEEN